MHFFQPVTTVLSATDGAATLSSVPKNPWRVLYDCVLGAHPHDNDLYFDLSPSDIDFQATYIRHCITHDQPWEGATSSYSTGDARNTIDIDAGRKSSHDDCFISGLEAANVWGPAKLSCGPYPEEVNFSVFFNLTFQMAFSHDEFMLEDMHIAQQGECAGNNVWWIGGSQCQYNDEDNLSLVCSVPNTTYTVTFRNEESLDAFDSNTFSVSVSPYLQNNLLDFEMSVSSSGIFKIDGMDSGLDSYCVSDGQLWGGLGGYGIKSELESYMSVIVSLEEASTTVNDCVRGSLLPSTAGVSSPELYFTMWGALSFSNEVGTIVSLNDIYISKGISGSDTSWFIGGPECGEIEQGGFITCNGQGGTVVFSSSSTSAFGVSITGDSNNLNNNGGRGNDPFDTDPIGGVEPAEPFLDATTTGTEKVQSISSSSARMNFSSSWLLWTVTLFHVVAYVSGKTGRG